MVVWIITSNFASNIRAMHIVTTREFRANQKKYFELAERETVFVSRKNARPILISGWIINGLKGKIKEETKTSK